VKLDTENNLLSVMLLGGIGLLALAGLVVFVLFGRADVESIDPVEADSSLIDRPVATKPPLAEFSEYSAIIERPLFFADRQLPVIELAGDEPGSAVEEPEPEPAVEIPDLEATLAGIIITPELKLAMVTDNSNKETLVLREGMAMGGDKSAWKIAEIRARGVQFQTDGGRTQDLELEVETAALETGAPPQRRTAASDEEQEEAPEASADQNDGEQADARARAEEIRRRVAERRAQLRAEAERRAREQNDGG